MGMTAYQKKLLDPRWQKRRLRALEAAGWKCQRCGRGDQTLHVHHKRYRGEPWEAPDSALEVLCETHHGMDHGKTQKDNVVPITRPVVPEWPKPLLDPSATVSGMSRERWDDFLGFVGLKSRPLMAFLTHTSVDLHGGILVLTFREKDRFQASMCIDKRYSKALRDMAEVAFGPLVSLFVSVEKPR